MVRIVGQSSTDLAQALIEAGVEIEVEVSPDLGSQLLSRHDFAGAIEQDFEHASRPRCERNRATAAQETTALAIESEHPEAGSLPENIGLGAAEVRELSIRWSAARRWRGRALGVR